MMRDALVSPWPKRILWSVVAVCMALLISGVVYDSLVGGSANARITAILAGRLSLATAEIRANGETIAQALAAGDELTAQIHQNTHDISVLQADVAALQTQVTALEARDAVLEEEVTALDTQLGIAASPSRPSQPKPSPTPMPAPAPCIPVCTSSNVIPCHPHRKGC